MSCACIKKGAAERLDWLIGFADWLIDGDTITAADAPISTGLDVEANIEGGTAVRLWISGGEAGVSYLLRLKITTAGGRVRNECVRVRVK
ncbi:phage fiber-tail adaptor protein [Bradyrhizobium elkanii]|uniref:phage fiber-tail adaptor protein n=1 Tax=Bradyrhizobium elkanii TaxID=29448 RepID=UPI003511724B